MSQINTELGFASSASVSLQDSAVRTLLGKSTSSSQISLYDGYGKSAATVLSRDITWNLSNYDMRADAIALGWDGVKALNFTVTLNAGYAIMSASTGSYAFYVSPTFPAGSKLTLVNWGYIVGRGGDGGRGGDSYVNNTGNGVAGNGGGPALYAGFSISINNGGYIGGGGGGGGGGGVF